MPRLSSNMLIYMVRMAWRYAGAARWRLGLMYGLLLAANLGVASQPLVMARIINAIQAGGDGLLPQLAKNCALYAGLTILFWTLHGPARVIERRVGFVAFRQFVNALYGMVTEMPLRWHQDHHSGATINRINKAGRALFNFTQDQFLFIQMIVRFCVAMAMLGYYSPYVLAASLGISGLIMLVIRRFDRVLVGYIRATNEREHRLNATLFDYISNIITILTLRVQGNTRDEVSRRIDDMRPTFWGEVLVNEWKWGLVNMSLVVTQIGITFSYIYMQTEHHQVLQVGSVVAIFQYLLMISQVFYDAASTYGVLMQRHTDMHGVDGLTEAHARQHAAHAAATRPWQKIEIQKLSFTHHEGDDALHHLREVSLPIAAGKKIALIGTSGSGKTTLLTLLRGLYDAQSVRLMIDGEAFDTLEPLSGFTTLVPQDSDIFENTVLYNLTLGTAVPDAVVQQAVHVTTFDDVVPKLPDGLATDIRERGVNLSGGQKQRLALARGLIAARDSSLLLLDEPTSSVDLVTENTIFERLFEAFADKTIVASVHRLHLLPRFDYIGLMQDGVMVEQGTLAELLEKKGAFYRLWQYRSTAEVPVP